MYILDGKVADYNEKNSTLTITARVDNIDRFIKCNPTEARVGLVDSRAMSNEQRKKVYALIGEIAEYCGEASEIMKKQMKLQFRLKRLEGLAKDFSLANAPMELCSDFIDFLVEFCIEWQVPTKKPLIELCEDIARYEWYCLKSKRCAACGRKAQLHHVDVVGMSRNRDKIDHHGMRCLPLCEAHHMEAHEMGEERFLGKYHLEAANKINDEIIKIYKLKSKKE